MDVEEALLTWRDEGTILVDVLVDAMVPEEDEEVLEEDEEMALWNIVTIAKNQTIRSSVPLIKEKLARSADVSATILDVEQM